MNRVAHTNTWQTYAPGGTNTRSIIEDLSRHDYQSDWALPSKDVYVRSFQSAVASPQTAYLRGLVCVCVVGVGKLRDTTGKVWAMKNRRSRF